MKSALDRYNFQKLEEENVDYETFEVARRLLDLYRLLNIYTPILTSYLHGTGRSYIVEEAISKFLEPHELARDPRQGIIFSLAKRLEEHALLFELCILHLELSEQSNLIAIVKMVTSQINEEMMLASVEYFETIKQYSMCGAGPALFLHAFRIIQKKFSHLIANKPL